MDSFKKFYKKNNIVFNFVFVVLFLVLSFIGMTVTGIIEDNDVSISNEEIIEKLAAGPQIPYNDPFIASNKTTYPKVKVGDPYYGDTQAKITIFEYANIDCTDCLEQQKILAKVLRDYNKNQVRLVWKGTATTAIGVYAQQAISCAGIQNNFLDYHLYIYDQRNALSRQLFGQIAEKLGLEITSFDTCLDQAMTARTIYQNNGDAIDLQVDTMPYFFINNIPFRGPLSEDNLRLIIKYFLGK